MNTTYWRLAGESTAHPWLKNSRLTPWCETLHFCTCAFWSKITLKTEQEDTNLPPFFIMIWGLAVKHYVSGRDCACSHCILSKFGFAANDGGCRRPGWISGVLVAVQVGVRGLQYVFYVTRFGRFFQVRKMLRRFLPCLSELWMGFVLPVSKMHTEMLGLSLRPGNLERVKRETFSIICIELWIGRLQRVFSSAYFRNVPLPASFNKQAGSGGWPCRHWSCTQPWAVTAERYPLARARALFLHPPLILLTASAMAGWAFLHPEA